MTLQFQCDVCVVPDQAPSREPPFGAWEEGGPPGTPEQNRNAASEGGTPGAPSLNRNPDPMKSFQMRDEGLGRAPRGLLQADDMARLAPSCPFNAAYSFA